MCEGRRRRPRGGGGPGAGAQGLSARRAAPRQQRRPAPRPPAQQLPADAAPRPHSGSPALAGPNAPARPEEVEGGAALSASAPPLRPREFPAPPCGAAPRSGGGGDGSVQSGGSRGRATLQGGSVAAARGFGSRRGSGGGELTDRSADRRGRNASGARKSPRASPIVARSKRLLSSLPHTERQPGASRALSRQPAGRAPLIGAAHVGGRGRCADARAPAAPTSRRLLAAVCHCVCVCVCLGCRISLDACVGGRRSPARRVACLWR